MPDDHNTPEDRLRANLKTPYPEEDTWWDNILSTLGNELGEIEKSRENVLASKVVGLAEGKQLELLGGLVQLKRNTGESDAHYRGRLKVQLRKFIGGATIDEIKSISAILLQTEKSEIAVQEDFDTEAARFSVGIWQEDLNSVGVTDDEFKEFIDEVRGAGINTISQVRGTFTYRSEQDYIDGVNTSDYGYNNGTYAGLL